MTRVNPLWFFISFFLMVTLIVGSEFAFGQDKFDPSKVNDTLLVEVVSVHSEDTDRDVIECVDGAGELWGFYAVKDHTLEKGDHLYLTIENGRCVAAIIQ